VEREMICCFLYSVVLGGFKVHSGDEIILFKDKSIAFIQAFLNSSIIIFTELFIEADHVC